MKPVLVGIPLFLAACNHAPASEGPARSAGAGDGTSASAAATGAVPVRVAPVTVQALEETIEISGSLASPEDSTIAAEVDGKLVGLRVDLGDRVRRGEMLARVNPDEYRFRMEQAEAQRQQAEANLRRVEQLARSEMVAAQQLDDARSAAAQARAMADLAKKKFADTEVRAPFDGAIAKRNVSAGEYVRVGQPLFEVVILDPLKITGEVPERYLSEVRAGDEVEAHVDAFPGRGFAGKISRISPAVNPQSRAFTVEARIGGAGVLKPGLFAKVHLHRAGKQPATLVPEAAVTAFAGVSKVYVIVGGLAHERPVEVVRHLEGGQAVVKGQLQTGEQVAVAGVARLADGVPVVIK